MRAVLTRNKVLAGTILLGAVGIIAFALLWMPGADEQDTAVRLEPDKAETVRMGAAIYSEHCADCHGSELEGQPNWRSRDADDYLPAPPHDETGHTWHHSDELLFRMTKVGVAKLAGGDYRTKMPAYDGVLTDQQIIAVLSYIKSRWPERMKRRHDRINAAARANPTGAD